MSQALSLAGFQVTLIGRFWVTAEGSAAWRKPFGIWSGLSESNRHLNLGKVREVKSNTLERRHLAFFGQALIGK